MRGTLQYAYSISVFLGVLVTSYFMMDRDNSVPTRSISAPTLRTEANAFDPAVNQLLEMEDALSKLRRDRGDSPRKRAPSDVDSGRARAAD